MMSFNVSSICISAATLTHYTKPLADSGTVKNLDIDHIIHIKSYVTDNINILLIII